MLLIVVLSSLSKPLIPQPSGFQIDKLYHLIEYGILSFWLIRAFKNSSKNILSNNAIFLTVLVTVVFGLTDEIHQAFVPGRFASVADLVFDSIGAAVGVFAFRLWLKVYAKLRKNGEVEHPEH